MDTKEEVFEELQLVKKKLRKHYSVQCLEELLQKVREDDFYLFEIEEIMNASYHEHKITFELRCDKAYIIQGLYERPWWKFWER